MSLVIRRYKIPVEKRFFIAWWERLCSNYNKV